MEKTRIFYIAGDGRSGSTIIGNILGEVGNSFTVGELGYAWNKDVIANQYCSCGKEFNQCDIWCALMWQAFQVDEKEKVEAPTIERFHKISRILSLYYKKSFAEGYLSFLHQVYLHLMQIAKTDLLIDESKDPEYLTALHHLPNVELRILHLVRDPRAVAYSWQRPKKRSVFDGVMPMFGPRRVAVRWLKINFILWLLYSRDKYYQLMRYEDFVNNPRQQIQAIIDSAKISGDSPFVDGDTVMIKKDHHLVNSNPVGSQKGTIRITNDGEWQEKMPLKQKLLITLLTWPFLLKYKYPIFP